MRKMFSEKQIKRMIQESPSEVVEALKGQDINVEGITSKGIANTGNIANIGDIATTGNITGGSIIQDNSGYSKNSQSVHSKVTITYQGVVQNGNKLTLVIAGEINGGEDGVATYTTLNIGGFTIPSSVGEKIIPISGNYVAFNRVIAPNADITTFGTFNEYVSKPNNTNINFIINTWSTAISANATYLFRCEVTFLLSENLASQE